MFSPPFNFTPYLVLQDYPQEYMLLYFFKFLRVLSLQNACRIFYDLHIPTWVGKSFQCMVFTFLENALNLCMFTHAPVPHSKLQVEVFENYFPPRRKGWRKLWFAQQKFNWKIWRWLGILVYLHLVWVVIFLNVMDLQFCK